MHQSQQQLGWPPHFAPYTQNDKHDKLDSRTQLFTYTSIKISLRSTLSAMDWFQHGPWLNIVELYFMWGHNRTLCPVCKTFYEMESSLSVQPILHPESRVSSTQPFVSWKMWFDKLGRCLFATQCFLELQQIPVLCLCGKYGASDKMCLA